jgi:hypothetical protein
MVKIMRALCLITIKPGTIDKVMVLLSKRRKIAKDVLPVTGRADICVLMNGSIDDINTAVMDFKKIGNIVGTETLMEMEVDLGW